MKATQLARGEVHVAWVATADAADPGLFAAYGELMNDEERGRRDRFLYAHKRLEFSVTRALVRTTLSCYAPVEPRAWTFRINAWGCPEIASPAEFSWLRFNLSNTFGLVACAVANDRDIGIDVEDTERRGETTAIADRFFSAREVKDLHAVPEAQKRSRFFDYWTLKEAYIKARGMGLAIPLGHFSFAIAKNLPIRIAFDPALDDDPTSWQFEQVETTPRHRLSLAIRRRAEPDVRLVVYRTVPLVIL